MLSLIILLLLLLVTSPCISSEKLRKVHVVYPVELLHPVTGTNFRGNATRNKLSCFGNRDFSSPSYKDAIVCMIQLYIPFVNYNCDNIWGSRSVEVESVGNLEVLKVSRLPEESDFNEHIALNATRWLEITHAAANIYQREVKDVPAEPIYLCVRSNDWIGSSDSASEYTSFQIQFNSVRIRETDRSACQQRSLRHAFMILLVSSIWLLPYLVSTIVAFIIYSHGMQVYFSLFIFSSIIVCFGPLMLTNHNRHLAKLYLAYFYTRGQANETKNVIRERLPFFQAIFFSSLLLFTGSLICHILFTYFGLNREHRNDILLILLIISACWFVFFLVRSFQRFVRNWLWIILSILLTRILNIYVNPMSKDEIVVATMVITYCFKFGIRSILRFRKSYRKTLTAKAIDYYNNFIPPLSLPLLLDFIFDKIQFYNKRRNYRSASVTSKESIVEMECHHEQHQKEDLLSGVDIIRSNKIKPLSSSTSSNLMNVNNNNDYSNKHGDLYFQEMSAEENNDIIENDDDNDDDDDEGNDYLEDLFLDNDQVYNNNSNSNNNSSSKVPLEADDAMDTNDFLTNFQSSLVSPFFEGSNSTDQNDGDYEDNIKQNDEMKMVHDNIDNQMELIKEREFVISNNKSDINSSDINTNMNNTNQLKSLGNINMLITPYGEVLIDKSFVYAPHCSNNNDLMEVLELVMKHLRQKSQISSDRNKFTTI